MSREYTDAEIAAAIDGTMPEDLNAPEPEPAPAEEVVEEQPAEAVVEAPAEAEPEAPAEAEAPVVDDWQAKAKKIQAAKDREVAAMQAELQKLREEMAEQRGRQAAREELQTSEQSAQAQAVTAQDLQDGINQNLAHTFQWTVANRPDLVPELISMVRDTEGYGHRTADQMVVEYTNYQQELRQAQLDERLEQLNQQREAEQAPLRSREAMEDVVAGLTDRFGENFEAAQGQIAERMETEGRAYIDYLSQEAAKNGEQFEVTPELVREMMVDIYLEIREGALNAAAAAPQQPQETPPGAAVLGGSAHDQQPTDDDEEFLAAFVRGAAAGDITVDPKFLP